MSRFKLQVYLQRNIFVISSHAAKFICYKIDLLLFYQAQIRSVHLTYLNNYYILFSRVCYTTSGHTKIKNPDLKANMK